MNITEEHANRVQTESDTGHEDAILCLKLQWKHISMKEISRSSWRTCSVVTSSKQQTPYSSSLQLRRVENNINKSSFSYHKLKPQD